MMSRKIRIAIAFSASLLAASLIYSFFFAASAKRAENAKTNSKRTSFLEANSKLPKSDVAVLPLFIKAPPVYLFDINLRRGFDRIATALNEAFSKSTMPLPGAIDEIYDQNIFTLGSKDLNAALINQFCSNLNVSTIYLGTVSFGENKMKMSIQDFNCAAGSFGKLKEFIERDGLSFEVMEELEMSGALAINKAVNQSYPGSFGAAAEGADTAKSDANLLKQGFDYLDKNDPFSLIQGIDVFSRAISLNPKDPRAWAGLSECYAGLGYTGIGYYVSGGVFYAEAFQLPAFAAARIALALDPKNFYAGRAAAFIDSLALRQGRGRKEIDAALLLKPDDLRAQAIRYRYGDESNNDFVKLTKLKDTYPDNIFVQTLFSFDFDKTRLNALADRYPSLVPAESANMLLINLNTARRAGRNWSAMEKSGLTLVHGSALLGERIAADFQAKWIAGSWPVVPDINAPQFSKILDETDPELIKWATRSKDSGMEKSIDDFKDSEVKLKNLILENPARLRAHQMPSLSADPMLVMKYLDKMSLEGLFVMDRLIGYSLGLKDAETPILKTMFDQYSYLPEDVAWVLKRYVARKDLAQIGYLLTQYGDQYLDDPQMMFAIAEYAEKLSSAQLPMNYLERMPYRWPPYMASVRKIAELSAQLPGDLCDNIIQSKLSSNPKDADAYKVKVKRLEWLGDFSGARNALLTINKITNSNEGDLELPKLNNIVGNFDANIKMSNSQYSFLSPEDELAAFLGKGDIDGAAKSMEKDRGMGPIYQAACLAAAGNIYSQYGDAKKAMEYYEKAAQVESGSAAVMEGFARGYYLLGQYDRSDQQYLQAIQRYPTDDFIKLKYAWTLSQRGEMAKAEELLLTVFKSNQNLKNLAYLWQLRVKQDKNKDLASIYSDPLNKNTSAEIFYLIGMFDLFERNDSAAAQKTASEIKRIAPDNTHSGMLEAQIALAKADYADAEKISVGLLGNKSYNPMTIDFIYLKSLARANKFKQADRIIQDLQAKAAGAPIYYLALAELALSKGDIPAARESLTKLAPMCFVITLPWEIEPYLKIYLAEDYIEFMQASGSEDDAMLAITALSRLGESNSLHRNFYPWIWEYYLGLWNEKQQKHEEAKSHYKKALEAAPGFSRAKARLGKL